VIADRINALAYFEGSGREDTPEEDSNEQIEVLKYLYYIYFLK